MGNSHVAAGPGCNGVKWPSEVSKALAGLIRFGQGQVQAANSNAPSILEHQEYLKRELLTAWESGIHFCCACSHSCACICHKLLLYIDRDISCCWTCCMGEWAFIFSLIQEMKKCEQLHADEGCINKRCSLWPQNKDVLIQCLSLQHYPHFPFQFEHLQSYFQQKWSKQDEDKQAINFSIQHTSSVVRYIQNKTHRKDPRRLFKRWIYTLARLTW